MLDHIDNLLRQVLIDGVDLISDESQVRFQPPDEDWRTYVSTLTVGGNPANALNVYLVDLRENRKLRTNERDAHGDRADGIVRETPAPRRVDCHYLISAWSPADVSRRRSSRRSTSTRCSTRRSRRSCARDPLDPARVYAPDPLPAALSRGDRRTSAAAHAAAGRRLPEARGVLGNDGRGAPLEAGCLPHRHRAGALARPNRRADGDDDASPNCRVDRRAGCERGPHPDRRHGARRAHRCRRRSGPVAGAWVGSRRAAATRCSSRAPTRWGASRSPILRRRATGCAPAPIAGGDPARCPRCRRRAASTT